MLKITMKTGSEGFNGSPVFKQIKFYLCNKYKFTLQQILYHKYKIVQLLKGHGRMRTRFCGHTRGNSCYPPCYPGFWNNMKSELNVEDNHEDGIRGLQRLQEVIDCWRYRNHSHKAFIHVIINLKWRFCQPQYLYFYLWIIIFAVDCNFWTAGWILKL